ncbi:MAG: metallophosphoesterase family protein [Gemmatimonadota bacterium]
MRIAALYDIHGNLPALEAVLDDVRAAGVDEVVMGGDVLPGPMPAECVERLLGLDLPIRFIHGNGDRAVLQRKRGVESGEYPASLGEVMEWNAAQISSAQQAVLEGWPSTVRAEVPGLGRVLFCHATPRNDTEIFTALTPAERLHAVFDGVEADVVVCGHTHMPFERTVGGLRVVNAGSVGMPFGPAGADWLLLGPDIDFRHTDYDLEAAAAAVRATAYPQAESFAANNVLVPPSAAAMLEALEKGAVR